MTERCASCVDGIRLMCDQAFASCADTMIETSARYDDDTLEAVPGRAEEVLDHVSFVHHSTRMLLKRRLDGYSCGLTEKQVETRLQETRQFRDVKEG